MKPLHLVYTLWVALALGSCSQEPQGPKYPYEIFAPNTVANLNGRVYCDSVRADGYCVDYWREGRQGRICGEYSIRPVE